MERCLAFQKRVRHVVSQKVVFMGLLRSSGFEHCRHFRNARETLLGLFWFSSICKSPFFGGMGFAVKALPSNIFLFFNSQLRPLSSQN